MRVRGKPRCNPLNTRTFEHHHHGRTPRLQNCSGFRTYRTEQRLCICIFQISPGKLCQKCRPLPAHYAEEKKLSKVRLPHSAAEGAVRTKEWLLAMASYLACLPNVLETRDSDKKLKLYEFPISGQTQPELRILSFLRGGSVKVPCSYQLGTAKHAAATSDTLHLLMANT